jgi:hypothetical protein
MKDIIIVLIIGFLLSKAYESYQNKHTRISDGISNTSQQTSESGFEVNRLSGSSNFKCDGRTHCSQMTSCDEATFFLQNCPNVEMDGNHDGEPCEKQWCS